MLNEIDDEDHIELELSSTRHRISIKKIVNKLVRNYLKDSTKPRMGRWAGDNRV